MQYYEKNMQVLKKRFNSVYKKIKNAEENNLFEINKNSEDFAVEIIDKENKFSIYIEEARRKGYTMKVKKDDKEIYFHSKYAPEREAKKIVKEFGFSSKKQIFILGTGLGYYLNQFDNGNKYNKIIVIEPFLSIFYAAVCYNNLIEFLSQDNIGFVLDSNNLFDIIQKHIEINLEKEIDFLEHKPSFQVYSEKYDYVYKKIKEGINYKKVGLVTNIKKTRVWRDNIIKNLPYIIANPKADYFFNRFDNVPAICVSAGPSLDKNIKKIKEAEGKALIICVDSAFLALINHNIKPNIVVSMDGNYGDFDNFKKWPELVDLNEIYLFAELANYYQIQEIWSDKKVFYTMNRNFSGWVKNIKGKYSVIQTGGTVAHSMVDLAYKFGSDPIILVGQDLAYDKEKKYVSGINREHMDGDLNKLIKVEGVNNDLVYTDESFKTMISFFNNYFSKRNDRLFINATEGGAKIDNTKNMKLDSVVKHYCQDEVNVKGKIHNLFLEFKEEIYLKRELEIQIKDTINELEDAIKISEKQIEAMDIVKEKLDENNGFSDQELDKLELSFAKYEDDLNDTKFLSYFIERILIAESMKLDKATSKYYMNKKKSLESRLEAYYNFRIKFLIEIKQSLLLLEQLYLTEDGNIALKKDIELEEREGLA